MTNGSGSQIEERWSRLATALADGLHDDSSRVDFWCLLENRLRTMLLHGPENDVAASRVRSRFSGILRDPHAAEDFISDLLVDLVRRYDEGFFHREEFRNMSVGEGLGMIASTGFVRNRAISHLRRGAAQGVVGLPAGGSGGRSLDAGEDGGLGASLVARTVPAVGGEEVDGAKLAARALDGEAVFIVDLSEIKAGAIVSTAGIELKPVLDPKGGTHPQVVECIESSLRKDLEPNPGAALDAAHARASGSLRREIDRMVEEIVGHPGMEVATIERWERRIVQARARLLIQPLDGRALADLCGLPSTNAGEQRISNYRRSLPLLLPALARLAGEEDLR